MMIDAHQHFWRLTDPGRDWPPAELAPIHRDFAPSDLEALLKENGVTATVLVQSQDCEDETLRMLAVAERTPWIAGVVGWVDLKSADAPERIARLAKHPKLRGLRPMLQSLEDVNWIADEALTPAIEAMLRAGLAFDALVKPPNLPGLIAFARRHPLLPIVIDHAAKPPIADNTATGWHADMAELAALPNVCCKLSGLVTEAAADWRIDDLRPWVNEVLERFGPERILWGSDWPVLNLAADYARWIATSRALLAHLDDAARAAIFGGNARRFYGLA
jgi:L-fuconolactonase